MMWRQIIVGWIRHKWSSPAWVLSVWGVVWAVTEPLAAYSPGFKDILDKNGKFFIFVSVILAACYLVVRLCEPRTVHFPLKLTNTTISLEFGDIYTFLGHMVVPGNDFFDYELGKKLSSLSIHGQMIERVYAHDGEKLSAAIDQSVRHEPYLTVKRADGERKQYPIGTTAVLTESGKKYFLLALSTTDINTFKMSADVGQLWFALTKLWERVRNEANNDIVNVPLIGGAHSGVGIEPKQLLNLLVLSIAVATKQKHITKHIRFVLHADYFDRVDLREVRASWAG